MVTGIEHFGVYCQDSKKMCDWYCDHFNMQQVFDNGNGVYFVKAADGSMLEICPMTSPTPPEDRNKQGLRHIALSVKAEDFDTMVAKIKAQGLEVLSEAPADANPRTFFFRDPEGNILHFIYRAKPL